MRPIKFRAWDEKFKRMFDVDVLAISPVMWDSGGTGVSLAYQPHIKVMQYTGLKDKNGKEIYEGDIVRHATDEGVYKVIFEDGGFYVKNLFEYDFQTINEYPLEIIGNIYENPELLKEGEE